jgi:hypothetical protein
MEDRAGKDRVSTSVMTRLMCRRTRIAGSAVSWPQVQLQSHRFVDHPFAAGM